MIMTWEVIAVERGTRIDITADDVPDGISAEDHATGLALSLANLAEYVEREVAHRRGSANNPAFGAT